MEQITSIIGGFLSSFSLTEAFSSLPNFMGSGYIFIAVVALVAFGLVKKVVKLCVVAGCVFLIWVLCTTGGMQQILDIIQNSVGSVIG